MSRMPLSDFYERVAPLLLGESSHADTVAALYGESDRASKDAARLAIYQRFCRIHRFEVLDSIYIATRAWVIDQHSDGEAAWEALVEGYFRSHPMHHFELNQNGEHFAEYLAGLVTEDPRLPRFVAELADLEWWEWLVIIAPDDAADAEPDSGPLRLGSTVEIRPYEHDLLSWLDSDDDGDERHDDDERDGDDEAGKRPPAPAARRTLVLLWRDRDLDERRGPVSALELQVLKAVTEGVALDAALAARIGVPLAELAETAADLHAAGIVLGDSAALPALA
jgi:hypothetical protein